MALNDTLLSIVRILYIVLLLVFIYTAVEGAYFIHDVRLSVTQKIESGEIFEDLARASDDPPMQQLSSSDFLAPIK